MIGRTIHNYVVTEQIGEGGMGAVYLAEHPKISRRVAIKVLLPRLSRDPQLVTRFFNEARAASEIRNEHIVDILDFGELEDGSHYIIMEWLAGRSLGDTLAREGRLSLPRSIHIARGIGRALGAAHARGIVHRDLKPDNIFLIAHGEDADFVKVLDFGIAKLMLEKSDFQTQAGAIMGTPYYMSPEQCNGAPVDQRTDVYSMGIMLYQMLCGRLHLFQHASLGALIAAHLTEAPPPPTRFEPSIPRAVEQAVLQALEKEPDSRFASVEALVRAFGDVQTGGQPVYRSTTSAVAASTTPLAERARAWRARGTELVTRAGWVGSRPQLVLLGGATLLVVLLLGLVFGRSGPTPTLPAAASVPTDTHDASSDALLAKLRDGRNCKERRVAAQALIATNDQRFLDALRAARQRKGNGFSLGALSFGGGSEANACMRKELDAAIHKLEAP